jgi:hypothetical protein
MGEIIGRDIEVGVSVENTRGTAMTVAEKWLKKVVCNITNKAEHAVDDSSHGDLADSDNRRVVKKFIQGGLEGIVHADVLGYFLYNLYGAVSSSNVAGSVYDHEFTLGQSVEHPSLSLFVKDGSVQQLVFNNAMIGSFEISAAVDDFVRFSAAFMAKDEANNTDTPSYDTEYDFIGKDITVKIADSEAGLSAATALKIKELTVSFDPGPIMDHVCGSYTPDDIYNSKMSIEGSFVKNFTDEVFKDLYQGDTAKYMQIVIAGEANIGGSNHPTITILLNKVKITGWDRSGGNDELVTENVEFKAFLNLTDNQQSKITVRNLTVEYDQAPST